MVAHEDRIARFGFDCFAWLCNKNDGEIVVLNEVKLSPDREIVEEVLAIVYSLSARVYGLKKYFFQIGEDKDLPRRETPSNLDSRVSGK